MSPVISPSVQPNALFLGSSAISRAYMGSTQVWPAVFSPIQLAGLSVWLDASQLVLADGAAVSPWPNLANAAQPGTMLGTPAPKMSTSKLKGQNLVRFSLNEGRLRMTGLNVDKAYTLAYVARMVLGGNNIGRIVSAAYPPSNFLLGYWNGYEDVAYSPSGAFFLPDMRTSVTVQWRLYSSDANAPPSFYPRLFNNGVLLSTGGSDGSAGADSFSGTFSLSGYDPTLTPETCDFEIAEVVLYNRKLLDSDRQKVEAYLRAKWLA
jgi:hypothetical protein